MYSTLLIMIIESENIDIRAIKSLLAGYSFSPMELAKIMIEYIEMISDDFRIFRDSVGYCPNLLKSHAKEIMNLKSSKALALFKLFYMYGMDLNYIEDGESLIYKCSRKT